MPPARPVIRPERSIIQRLRPVTASASSRRRPGGGSTGRFTTPLADSDCRLGLGIARPPGYSDLRGYKAVVEFSFFSNSSGVSVAEIVALTGGTPYAGADLSRMITGIAPIDLAGA